MIVWVVRGGAIDNIVSTGSAKATFSLSEANSQENISKALERLVRFVRSAA